MLSSLVERLNDRRRADEEVGEDAGFTLIELMVVLLIMAILLAIAIPTFLGVTGSANDRAAQSNLNTALTSAKGVYESNQQSYPATSVVISDIASDEPSLSVVSDPGSTTSIAAGDIGVYVSAGGNGVVLYSLAKKTNECWWVADNTQAIANGGTTTSPNPPWTASGAGIPNTAGDYYGVFKATGSTYCDVGAIGSTPSSQVKTSGFPPAAAS
ncbi:MAG: type II secretion system protein [Acidimicrobiales bacterium]